MKTMFISASELSKKPNFVIGLIISTVMMSLAGIGSALSLITNFPVYVEMSLLNLGVGSAIASLSCLLYVRFIEKRDSIHLGLQKEHLASNYLKGILLGGATLSIVYIITVLIGGYQGRFALTGVGIVPISLMLVGYVIQGFTEELVYRGWLLPLMSAKYGKLWGILLSSLAFTIAHGVNPGMTYISVLNIFLIAVILALIVIKTGNIWMAAAFHTIWNWMQGSVFGVSVSGFEMVKDSVFKSLPMGKELITGGAFGLEGSIITSSVIIILIGGIIITSRNKEYRD